MNYFTIRDIENLSGIKAHTLRIWERRYGIISPKRKESKQRFYDNEDLKQILRITHLYNNGYKISSIVNMQKYESSVYETQGNLTEEAFVKMLVEAAIDVNETLFNTTLNRAINVLGVEECTLEVIYPYFEKIGTLWLNSKALPAQERFASNIILKKIINEIDKLDISSQKDKPAILLFTPPLEYHEIPLLFMYYLLKKNHQHVYYLGTNISFDILDAFIKINNAEILFFHPIINLTHNSIDNYVKQLTQRFSRQKIIMSGKLTQTVSLKAKNLRLLKSADEMIAFGRKGFINL